MASVVVARLSALFGLDTKEFEAGAKKISRELDNIEKRFDTVSKVGAAAFAVLSGAALNYADDAVDAADANEVAIDTFIVLGRSLEKAGGQAANAGKALSSFATFIDRAVTGSKEAQDRLKSLGITFQDLKFATQEELFNRVLKSIAAIKDPITRNAAAMEAFGRAAKGVNIQALAAGLAAGDENARKQAEGMKAAADAAQNLEDAYRDLLLAFNTAFGPIIRDTTEWFRKMSADGDFTRNIKALGAAMLATFGSAKLLASIRALQVALSAGLLGIILGLASLALPVITFLFVRKSERTVGDIDKEIAGYENNNSRDAQLIRQRLQQERAALLQAGKSRGRTAGSATYAEIYGPRVQQRNEPKNLEAEALAKALAAAQARAAEEAIKLYEANEKVTNSFIRGNRITNENLMLRINSIGLSEEQAALLNNEAQATQRMHDALAALDIEALNYAEQAESIRNASAEQLAQQQALTTEYYRQAEALRMITEREAERERASDDLRTVMRDLYGETDANKAKLGEYEAILDMAFKNGTIDAKLYSEALAGVRFKYSELGQAIQRNVITPQQAVAQQVDSLFSNMGNALDEFVRSGKLSFSDFARSVIQDLIRIQLRAQATQFLGSALGSVFGGGISLPGRAAGGPVSGGQPYIVGERGPELFVPSASGNIIPNGSMGGGVINNYNITGYTDDQLVRRLKTAIAQDPKMIYGVAKQGEREAGVNSFR